MMNLNPEQKENLLKILKKIFVGLQNHDKKLLLDFCCSEEFSQHVMSFDNPSDFSLLLLTQLIQKSMLRTFFDNYLGSWSYGLSEHEKGIIETILKSISQPSQKQKNVPFDSANPITILFLASNPTDDVRLRLDQELRSIDEALRKAEFRDRFDFQKHPAVRVSDLQELLMRHNPDFVHFSGHGSKQSEIILENHLGKSKPVPLPALAELFSILKGNIRCVILNACYMEEQAKAISQHIDYVIGMSDAIGDKAAIDFSFAFYQAIGFGKDIETAFELGCSQIHLAAELKYKDTPKLLKK